MSKIPVKQYLKQQQRNPELFKALEQLGEKTKQAGPLDERQAQLIQLAAAAAIRSEGAVHSHARRALEAGATEEELYHTLLLLISTIGLPAVMAAVSWLDDLQQR
ncbi:carboxymuconolactone decarboxylase family protein [Marinobacterium jannaschii]|uniref:carboxymuconolactone decarboxylase family protein n=1 Tax=Marinobacterium jannaschii TaxID=64970 RepID=UPI00055BBCD4|nr:carboxymuconolactone decarboxylase family protein [Marinobacterium jannaschii]